MMKLESGKYQLRGITTNKFIVITEEERAHMKVILCDCHDKVKEKYNQLEKKEIGINMIYTILKLHYGNCFGLY